MKYETILVESGEGVATITLNRPKSMNALNNRMLEELASVFGDIGEDSRIKVVIITGHEKFFAAGADLAEVSAITNPMEAHQYIKRARKAFDAIEEIEKPVIAAVSGLALGGGCELCLACDLRMAAETAIFGQPEIRIGVIPGAGGTQRLPRIVGVTKAKELLFTGESIDASEALRIGLVNRIVPPASLLEETRKLALTIAKRPGEALSVTKMVVNGGMKMELNSALAYEAKCFEYLFSTEDRKEGMSAFVEKRKPMFKDR
ncbi:MAG TPA: enoyl-CoA hydratase-related protein [Smithellaceae bacterium]|jgi:enoyl-CoA hydratase|nr:enoyl-CoA hydratase-related protein [Smithellaceae bacterium]HPL68386.1 enoyl-CoA hydratase-related protein [Smithellaceae bacterium]